MYGSNSYVYIYNITELSTVFSIYADKSLLRYIRDSLYATRTYINVRIKNIHYALCYKILNYLMYRSNFMFPLCMMSWKRIEHYNYTCISMILNRLYETSCCIKLNQILSISKIPLLWIRHCMYVIRLNSKIQNYLQ